MLKSGSIIILFLTCLLLNSCGNLLEELAVGVTYEQKMRGIWIVGGLSNANISSVVAQVDLYDPESGRWFANVTAVPTPVSFAGVASCGGKIYVIGGFNSSGTCMSTNQIYDVNTNTWSVGAEIDNGTTTQYRANIDAESIYEKIYFIGGVSDDADQAYNTYRSNQLYEYDTILDDWSQPADPGYYGNSTCYAFHNIYYFAGGRSAYSSPYANHYSYETSTTSVVAKLTLSTISIRVGMAGAVYNPSNSDPTLILIGGFSNLTSVANYCYIFYTGTYNPTALLDVHYLYYPFTTVPWANADSYPISVGFASAAIYHNTLYCFGGTLPISGDVSVYADVYSLDLTDIGGSSWMAETAMPAARFGHTALTINQ
jgi:hypothetical protein